MAMRNMTVLRPTETDAKINLIDMNLNEVRATVQNRSVGRCLLEMECCIAMQLM
jgi:hypothetical protein